MKAEILWVMEDAGLMEIAKDKENVWIISVQGMIIAPKERTKRAVWQKRDQGDWDGEDVSLMRNARATEPATNILNVKEIVDVNDFKYFSISIILINKSNINSTP